MSPRAMNLSRAVGIPPKMDPLLRKCPTCDGCGHVLNDAEIGRRIRKRREAMGMSLRELARKAKCSAPYLSDLETGHRTIGPAALRVLAIVGMTDEERRLIPPHGEPRT